MAEYTTGEKYAKQREEVQKITNSERWTPPILHPRDKEKHALLNAVKSEHKQGLLKAGLNPKKVMNLPNMKLRD
jgi:hypothetical protein